MLLTSSSSDERTGTQEEAAEAYDIAAIKFRGLNAVTNFDMSRYDVNSILESASLPIGGAAKRLKDVEQAEFMAAAMDRQPLGHPDLADGIAAAAHYPTIAFQQPQMHHLNCYPNYYLQQKIWCKQEQQDQNPPSDIAFHDLNGQLHVGSSTHNFFTHPSPYSSSSLMSLDSIPPPSPARCRTPAISTAAATPPTTSKGTG